MATDYKALLAKNDTDLLEEIGELVGKTIENDPELNPLGLQASSFRDLGSAIVMRMNRQLHELICEGKGEEANKLKKMLSLDGAGMSAAFTGILILYFSISPGVAPLIAVVIVKNFILPAGEEICLFWSSKIT